MLRGNIVIAAAVLGIFIFFSGILALVGTGLLLDRTLDRIGALSQEHGQLVRAAGERAGDSIRQGVEGLNIAVNRHSEAMTLTGTMVREGFGDLAEPIVDHRESVQ